MAPDIITPTLTAGDLHLVATLQAQLSDELGRVTYAATPDLAWRLARHIQDAVHLERTRAGDVNAWVMQAMLLLGETARILTPYYQSRNDISLVPEDVTTGMEVAA
jgi:hypothetical protein